MRCKSSETVLIVACILSAQISATGASTRPALLSEAESVLLDPHSSDDSAIKAAVAIRTFPVELETPDLWHKIANASSYTVARRGLAITELVDRHVLPGMSLSRVAKLLVTEAWVQKQNTDFFTRVNGGNCIILFGPLNMVAHLPQDFGKSVNTGFEFSFDTAVATNDIYLALLGQVSVPNQVRFLQAGVFLDANPKGASARLKLSGLFNESPFPDHWSPNSPKMDKAMEAIASEIRGDLRVGDDLIRTNPALKESIETLQLQTKYSYNVTILSLEYDVGRGATEPGALFRRNLSEFAGHVADHLQFMNGAHSDRDKVATQCNAAVIAATSQILAFAAKLNESDRDDYEMSLDQLLVRDATVLNRTRRAQP